MLQLLQSFATVLYFALASRRKVNVEPLGHSVQAMSQVAQSCGHVSPVKTFTERFLYDVKKNIQLAFQRACWLL